MSNESIHIELIGQGWGLSAKEVIRVRSVKLVLHADRSTDVIPLLQQIDAYTQNGMYAFGFLAYEAASAFGFTVNPADTNIPLIWFAVVDARDVEVCKRDEPHQSRTCVDGIRLSLDEADYHRKINTIKRQIADGNTYQTNYTIRAMADCDADAKSLFYQLYQNQPVPYAALIETKDWSVISLSPELFLKREGKLILSKPMKGTHMRGRYVDEDNRYQLYLQSSEKERAENIMIVDMMRNDLGRISTFGSVQVDDVFHVDALRTVLQMTSTVQAELKDYVSLTDIMKATYPAASVTGAPKCKTMGIIQELEDSARGVYCGALGMIQPSGDFVFNVAIRTLLKQQERLICGVGSGVVWDSVAEKEYQEIHDKTLFLKKHSQSFQLIETILLNERHELVYLDEHLSRLKQSARYFGYAFDEEYIRGELRRYTYDLQSSCVVRLLLHEDGEIDISHRTVTTIPDQPKIVISESRVNSSDPFLFHKTTNRDLYNEERKRAIEQGVFEVIFLNENGYVTEGSITNIFIYKHERWITPPIEDGLLIGVWRQKYLLEHNGMEVNLRWDDLNEADRIVVGNSVMGAVEVVLDESSS